MNEKGQRYEVTRGTLHTKDGRKIADVPAFSLSKHGRVAEAVLQVPGSVAMTSTIEHTELDLRFEIEGLNYHVVGTFDESSLGRGSLFSGAFDFLPRSSGA